MLIYVHIFYGSFCAPMAGLSSWDRDSMVCESENIYYRAFYKKPLPTPALHNKK